MMKRLIEMLMEAHKDQKYDGDPYFRHLFEVALEYMKLPSPTANGLTACLFHDFVEDSDFTNQDLVIGGMDWDAIALVDLLTDKPGKNRHERHLNTYPGIAANPEARKIKICDRYVNIKTSYEASNDKLLGMYRKEHPYFKEVFLPAQSLLEQQLWNRMDLWIKDSPLVDDALEQQCIDRLRRDSKFASKMYMAIEDIYND